MQTRFGYQSEDPLYPGMLATTGSAKTIKSFAASGAVARVMSITIGAASATLDALEFADEFGNSATISGNTPDGSAAETAQGVFDLLQASPIFGSACIASLDGLVITVTAIRSNALFTLTSSDANATVALLTAQGAAPIVPFGTFVVERIKDGEKPQNECMPPDASLNVAKVVTVSPTAEAQANYSIAIVFVHRDDLPDISVTFHEGGAPDDDQVVDGLVKEINEQAAPNTVVASNVGSNLVITAEIPGLLFNVSSSNSGTNPFVPVITTPNLTAHPLGVAVRIGSVEYSETGLPSYPEGGVISVHSGRDQINVICDDDAEFGIGTDIYYRQSASGSEVLGAVRNDSGGGDCLYVHGWKAAGPKRPITIQHRNGVNVYNTVLIERVTY
jgi:hypothetical protein